MIKKTNNKKQPKEYSKKILDRTFAIVWVQIIAGVVLSILRYDVSFFSYSCVSSFAILGTGFAFYYNKAKSENLLKIKIAFARFKIKLSDMLTPEQAESLGLELDVIEQSVTDKIDSSLQNSISEDVENKV